MELFNALFWKAACFAAGGTFVGLIIVGIILVILTEKYVSNKTFSRTYICTAVAMLVIGWGIFIWAYPVDHWYEAAFFGFGPTSILAYLGAKLLEDVLEPRWRIFTLEIVGIGTVVLISMISSGVIAGLLNFLWWQA